MQSIATNDPANKPLLHPDYFNVYDLFTVADLYKARVHYGHVVTSLDPRMIPYIYGERMGHVIFDLDKTAVYLRKALNVAAHIAYRNGAILFLGRLPSCTQLIENTAKECGEYANTRYWQSGQFTNPIHSYKMPIRHPDLCIFLNTYDHAIQRHSCIREAAQCLIPTIAIVDSNVMPSLITYPVPGNDDSKVSIELYCDLFKKAILRGKQKQKEDLEKEQQEQKQVAVSN